MLRGMMILVLFLTVAGLAQGATIFVPDDYPTIQGAIDASVNGDTIIVRPGTYKEVIEYLGKAITIKSEKGPDVTIIDGRQLSSVLLFRNGESYDSILDGFTITNGVGIFDSIFGYTCGGGFTVLEPLRLCRTISSRTMSVQMVVSLVAYIHQIL